MLQKLRARLGSELERLAEELSSRPTVGSGPGTNASHGATSAGDDLKHQVQRLGQLVAALPSVEPGTIWPDRAGFGSTVVLQDLDDGKESVHTLLTGEFIDVDGGEVSLASPIGQALLGRRSGEEIAVVTPRGQRRFRILSVRTPPRILGMADIANPLCA